ncbi:TRAP transporter small permease [Lacibacterium aquatile]|uniref:TRAP transporter small permease protein n=1 Tax=Lacibacterium aquatile TaxID=1168082 RepID=A0ABW5DRL8_9PROT
MAAILIERIAAAICRGAVWLAAGAVLACLVLICWSVGMRYLLHQPIPWVDEAVGYLLVAMVMLGAADALRGGDHLAVDIVTQKLGSRGKRITRIAGLLSVMLVGGFLLVEGLQTVAFNRDFGMRSTGYLSIAMWIPQLLIPAGGLLLTIAAFADLCRLTLGQRE